MEKLRFLTPEQVLQVQREIGTPVFVYDEASLQQQAQKALAMPNAFGLTVRYAMKACPTMAIIQILNRAGLQIDASSGYEAERALLAGIPASHIQITSQEIPRNLKELVERGVLFTACSLQQLRLYGKMFPGSEVCVRINPGLGSGHNNRTNVGGPSSSFGIWHEYVNDILQIAQEHALRITRMHTHIGSGGDPKVWEECALLSLRIAGKLPEVTTLSLGGGFKVARMENETSADLEAIGRVIQREFRMFEDRHKRQLHLEIEPGTFLVANAGSLVTTITDIVDTGGRRISFH